MMHSSEKLHASSVDALSSVRQLFESGQQQAAARGLEDAIREYGPDLELVRYGSWMFSTIGDEHNAFDCLQALAQYEALSDAQEALLASYCLGREQSEQALTHIVRACEQAPENVQYVRLRAAILQKIGKHSDAIAVLLTFMREHGEDPDIFLQISNLCIEMGKMDHALFTARHAWNMTPNTRHYAMHYAALLMGRGEFEPVLTILDVQNIEADEHTLYMLSISSAQLNQYDDALALISRAVEMNGDRADLLMHMGAVLCCLMRYVEAAEFYKQVLEKDPNSVDARRACFAAMTEAGLFADATKIGASIISDDPFDDQIGKSLQYILTRRFINGEEERGTGEAFLAKKIDFLAKNPRAQRAQISPATIQLRVIGALLLREMRTRFGKSRLGYAWAVFEPLAHILVMVTIISLMAHSKPPIGDHFAVFYFTGIIPYQLFLHTAGQMMGAIAANRPLLQLPPVNTLDVYFSRSLLEITTTLAVSSFFILGFLALGLKALPINPIGVLAALFLLWLTAVGVGIINAIISSFFDGWERIWGAITSIIYFTSGTFYIPRIMPENIREVLVWNPVLQAIEMVRVNYFHEPYPAWLDIPYMCSFAIVSLTLALVLERVYRRRLLDIE